MTDRLTPEREAEIVEHLAATENWSIGNLAARDLLAELTAVRAELAARTEHIAFLDRNTLPELHRTVQHHIDGKQRWRGRAERVEAERDALKKRLHDAAMTRTWRNEDGKKFVFVEDIAPILLGVEPRAEAASRPPRCTTSPP